MTEVSAEQQPETQSDESRVIRYLQDNPAILLDYPEIFSTLSIPHDTGDATSLVERQLKLLREENQQLKAKIEELVGIARDNEELNRRFHRLALELMNADQLHDVLYRVNDRFAQLFRVARVNSQPRVRTVHRALRGSVDRLFRQTVLGLIAQVENIGENLEHGPRPDPWHYGHLDTKYNADPEFDTAPATIQRFGKRCAISLASAGRFWMP